MTREEAAKILKEHRERKFKHTFYTLNEYQAATDMAIKALEQEPCEDATLKDIFCIGCEYKEQQPCEDCISRQAVLDINFKRIIFATTKPVEMIEQKVKALPPVAPQQKIGHWIGHREHCENLGVMPSGLGAYEWCSNCDCGIDVREWHRNHYNYCPNCGAKMV